MRRIPSHFFSIVAAVVLMMSGAVLAADPVAPSGTAEVALQSYHVGAGDKIRVTVFGEDELGGEFTIESAGDIRLPLIGEVKAIGLSAGDIAKQVTTLLKDGFLNDPRVNVEVTAYRPFYILGEVSRPGQYPYVSGMTVLNAIALAGGYTERARTGDIDILRSGQTKSETLPANQAVKIYPDDVLTVRQRYF